MNCSVSARRSVSRTTWPIQTGGRRSCSQAPALLPLQHHRHTDPARCANRHQAILLSGALQLIADRGDDAGAGRAEGMAEGDRSAGEVDLLRIDVADRLAAAEL